MRARSVQKIRNVATFYGCKVTDEQRTWGATGWWVVLVLEAPDGHTLSTGNYNAADRWLKAHAAKKVS